MSAEVTIEDLESRAAQTPAALAHLVKSGIPQLNLDLSGVTHFEAVGVGASEGPARLLVDTLIEAGICAQFRPISSFLSRGERASGRCLVLFSQGLSPNARIALEASQEYDASILVTALTKEPRLDVQKAALKSYKGEILRHEPLNEAGSLLRVLGPACAALTALLLGACLIRQKKLPAPIWLSQLPSLACPGPQEAALPAIDSDLSACLALGGDNELSPALMWKWQEALYAQLPLSADVLAFAHGPLQALYDRPGFILCLRRESTADDAMWQRLLAVIEPTCHQAIFLDSARPGPLAYFDYDAQLNRLLFAEMRRRNVDPARWPGQNKDAALYEVTRDSFRPKSG